MSLCPLASAPQKSHTHHEHTVFLEVYIHVINQNDHISLAHKALFNARNDDTIDFILPCALCGNILSVSVSNLCVCVCVSSSQSHPPPTLDSFQTTTPGWLIGLHLLVIYTVMQHLTHTPQCRRFTAKKEWMQFTFPEGLALHGFTPTPLPALHPASQSATPPHPLKNSYRP